MGITLNISVCRKVGTRDFGSYGASVGFEGIEIPGDATGEQIAAIHRHWLAVAEAAVGEELGRLGGGAPAEGRAEPPARAGRPPAGDDDRRQARADDDQGDDDGAPTNGRQLLGWASKQDPDAKDDVIAFGRRKGYPSKVVDWNRGQVSAAFRAVKGAL